MAKTENNNKKVPGALIVAVVVVIAIAAFVPTVYMPYKNKKPTMDAAHQEALDTMSYLDKSIEDQEFIESDIADLQAQWDKYQKDMFVNANSALGDLVEAIEGCDIVQTAYSQGDPTQDESGVITAEGNPLYYMTVNLSGHCTRENLLKFLKYVEQDSVGAYYVRTMQASPVKIEDSDGKEIGEELQFNMSIYLYYFNQDIVLQPAVEETDTADAGI